MRGFRFYVDYQTAARRRKGQHTGNIIAARVKSEGRRRIDHIIVDATYTDDPAGTTYPEIVAVEPIYSHPNSVVRESTTTSEYLVTCCKYTSEGKARDMHPKLFEYLDKLVVEAKAKAKAQAKAKT